MLVMRQGGRGRLRFSRGTGTRRTASGQVPGPRARAPRLRERLIRAVLNRVATAEMHHAALLLGYDTALGHGREGVLRHLDDFQVGAQLGRTVRYGQPAEREGAVEALIMELALLS
jgi:hypothetical protein